MTGSWSNAQPTTGKKERNDNPGRVDGRLGMLQRDAQTMVNLAPGDWR